MSKRNYSSGAQKRKERAEKDEKERQLLEKIPKITNMFQTSAENKSSADAIENTNIAEQSENSESQFALESDIESSESSFQQLSIASTLNQISNDPGLWDIQSNSNQNHLQAYWVKHGKTIFCLSNYIGK